MISPSDQQLILEGSEERRKFIDGAISQVDNHYLDDLIYYNKILQNRNALLKKMNENLGYDETVLEVFNHQLAQYAEKIYAKRKQFIDEFIPLFNELYQRISSGMEEVSIAYESQLNEHQILDLLIKNTRKDVITQRSNYGTHKDDLEFKLGEYPLKKFGSQGQQKSYLIALKLAHYKYLLLKKGYKPLLLLDDIFDKLDEARIKKLLAMVSEDAFGQIFITDTDKNRVQRIFEEIGVEARIFSIDKGTVEANK
jgi:DNA replication and repair protein RecF